MNARTPTSPKIIEMFEELKRFIEQCELPGGWVLTLTDVEAAQDFAKIVDPEFFEELIEIHNEFDELDDLLDEAMDVIESLEGKNALALELIDLQSEMIQGRVAVDEMEEMAGYGTAGVLITEQEYEELINLRKKRARDHKQLSSMDAKLKEYRKKINSLESSRNSWHVRTDDLLEIISEAWANLDLARGIAMMNDPSTWGTPGHYGVYAALQLLESAVTEKTDCAPTGVVEAYFQAFTADVIKERGL